jgi:hypothetical protein
MSHAAALREETFVDQTAPPPNRDEVLAQYHRLRKIGKHHHTEVMAFLSKGAIFEHARRLGLMQGKTIVTESMDQLTLPIDLAIYTAPVDRSRAIDRYARSAKWPPGSEEASMLEVMREARFGILQAQGRHSAVGLIVTEIFRQIDLWLVDEGLEATQPQGAAFACRFYTPGPFIMTAGVGMPIDGAGLGRVISSLPQLVRKPPVEIVQDRRFAEAVYRNAVEDGSSERAIFCEPGDGESGDED